MGDAAPRVVSTAAARDCQGPLVAAPPAVPKNPRRGVDFWYRDNPHRDNSRQGRG
ncbi:hypothetical protein NT01EI_1495 [Edwardsiella ictaluri 93-146]|uniref:Uncharacterized protein n=1 Tax=Edwardsiella ictaluri (strain 93-146) TaxID=634503 RepID=C5BFG4_EDWI9|nr:hypothetical protein NT01EI_1495 [Edwardsiella ictaluri 93-146]